MGKLFMSDQHVQPYYDIHKDKAQMCRMWQMFYSSKDLMMHISSRS